MGRAGVRLAVLDDNLFVRTPEGEVRPLSSTFHQFVEAVARSGHFECVRYLAPVGQLRDSDAVPLLAPIDASVIELVPTAWFSGIADYLLRFAYLSVRNWTPIDQTVAESELLWLRLPASNALLALTAARRHHVAHFGWRAGRAADVARVQRRSRPNRWAARIVGEGYDAVSRLAARDGPLIDLDADMFTSTITDSEIQQSRSVERRLRDVGPWRIVWSGRMAPEKGLSDIVEAVRLLVESDHDVTLVLVGDGPARPDVELATARLPRERVEWLGYVGDRATYMSLLRAADLYIHPSRAEVAPKVVVDALAAGVPVIATDVGAVAGLLGHGERGRLTPAGDSRAMAHVASELLRDPLARLVLRERGLSWAEAHTAGAQANRLIRRLRTEFPTLAWT